MNEFIKQHQGEILGAVSGLDRMRLRGTLRMLAVPVLLMRWLTARRVLIKDFGDFLTQQTAALKQAVEEVAQRCVGGQSLARQRAARERRTAIDFLRSSRISKEDLVAELIRREGLTDGVVCVLSASELSPSYEVHRNATAKLLEIQPKRRPCLHWYVYFLDALWGLCHVRIQSWLPFTVHVCVNGREMLCRELTRRGIGFERRDNCLVRVEDVATAQQILDSQPWAPWSTQLNDLLRRACPPLLELPGLGGQGHPPLEYYWSADETEWATDIMFRSSSSLAGLYPSLVHHGMTTFSSRDTMRFLGKVRIPREGVDVRFNGEVKTKKLIRPEGVCLKHWLNRNTLKMYDKQGTVLRVETTINDARDFGVHRASEKTPDGPKRWRKLRKGVVDLPRRAEISQACNTRYLTAYAAVESSTPLGTVADELARPVLTKQTSGDGRPRTTRARGLNPLTGLDAQLAAILLRGEFALNGFRNRDVRDFLFATPPPTTISPPARPAANSGTTAADSATTPPSDLDRRRQSGQVTRLLRLFRSHQLIQKIPHTHRYKLTAKGRQILPTFTAARSASTKKLGQLAA